MIKLQVIGNLGRDCAMNTVNGKTVINFSVAHTEKFRDAQSVQKEKTIWVECAYWTDKTGIAPYLKKGTQVYVEGAPDIRTYTTQDGRQGATLSLRVLNVQLLGTRSADSGMPETSSYQTAASPAANQASSAPPPGDIAEPVDDLPF